MTPRLDLIGMVIEDMAATVAFYRRLGLEFAEGAEGEGHVEVVLAGGLRLAWDTAEVVRSFDPEWTPPQGSSPFALAFLVDSPAEVDALHARLVAAGAHSHLEPFDAFWGQRYATVRDPDGYGVDIFAPLPG